MSDRPTVEQIVEEIPDAFCVVERQAFLDRLTQEGYVIVHPDDHKRSLPQLLAEFGRENDIFGGDR